MLKQDESKTQHWGKVDQLIESWLKERQDLIILYVAIDGLKELTPTDTPISVKLQAFSQMLIDYVSAGHFEVYDELTKEAEDFQEDYSGLVQSCLPRIQQSTELALDFNDKYANLELCVESLNQVATDLSLLGEKMVERFDLEDKLIETLHTRHRELVA
ncbi:MAG: sigma D regulator [Moraxellaceae bacterium]|nr:MAG: sigma D regulator [Moraxellaceae bacterium]